MKWSFSPPQFLVLPKLRESLQALDSLVLRCHPSLLLKLNYCAARNTSLIQLKEKGEAIRLVPKENLGILVWSPSLLFPSGEVNSRRTLPKDATVVGCDFGNREISVLCNPSLTKDLISADTSPKCCACCQ